MAKVHLIRDADPAKVWPGVAPIDLRGATIACGLLNELAWNDDQGDSIGYADLGCLEDVQRAHDRLMPRSW